MTWLSATADPNNQESASCPQLPTLWGFWW
nr:MAG TPA: hypothetical protein [Caudoviricetes sp.]